MSGYYTVKDGKAVEFVEGKTLSKEDYEANVLRKEVEYCEWESKQND